MVESCIPWVAVKSDVFAFWPPYHGDGSMHQILQKRENTPAEKRNANFGVYFIKHTHQRQHILYKDNLLLL